MSIFQTLAKLDADFAVEAVSKEQKLKEMADSCTLKHKNLENKIHQDAVKRAAHSGYSMPTRSDPDHDEKLRKYQEHVDFHMAHHAKNDELTRLSREALQHRLAYKRFLRSKTTAAETPEPANPELYARCKARAKKKFSVYPSWVSSQWVTQLYKKLGGKYK